MKESFRKEKKLVTEKLKRLSQKNSETQSFLPFSRDFNLKLYN